MPRRYLVTLSLMVLVGCQSQKQQYDCIDPSFSPVTSTLSASDLDKLDAPPYDNGERESLAVEYLKEQCDKLEVQEILKKRGNNIICRLPGKSATRIVVGAHYDRAGQGYGVADNWSGIVLLNRLAAELTQKKLNHTWELVAFGAEEDGLMGSKTFMKMDDGDGRILAMINVDTLGLGKVNVDSRSDKNLKCIANDLAHTLEIEVSTVRMSQTVGDWQPFKRQGIPVMNLHSLNQQSIKKVHTRKDRRSEISDSKLNDAWQLLINLHRHLDQDLLRN